MTKKEQIKYEIDNIREEYLDELYKVIKKFVEVKKKSQGKRFLSKLKEIKIDGPEDFSENIDLYLTGEKKVG